MNKKLKQLRHSAAHILAKAVKELYPEVKLGIGPAIRYGFYYDFDSPKPIKDQDLEKIEEKMKEIIRKDEKFIKKEIRLNEAMEIFKDEPYKLELLKNIENETVKVYKTGEFVDLCKGPHIKSAKKINPRALKLKRIAGAYWKGDEKNKMLTRIYGLLFSKEKKLKNHLKLIKEAKKRDHRKLGPKLDLFSFHSEAPGMPFLHSNGLIIFNELVSHWRKIQAKYDYHEVKLPNLLNVELWKKSGHYEHYQDNMFFTKNDKKEMALRPMDCPGAILLYQEKIRSYSELPLRISELGTVFRNEKSGELHGLFRVQQITQDDAHIFLTAKKIEIEVSKILKIVKEIYQPFSMKKRFFLSTKPKDAMGDDETWKKAEGALKNALEKNDIHYGIKKGDGAFYGPKIDLQMRDSMDRTWQMGTIQLDFFMPRRFKIKYINKHNEKKTPVIIHRCLMGALERFIGILTEHYAGAFPFWLSPVQVILIPVSGEKNMDYCMKVKGKLEARNIRAKIDKSLQSVSKRICSAEVQRIPYILVIGDKEEKSQIVSIRKRGNEKIRERKLEEFREILVNKIKNKD